VPLLTLGLPTSATAAIMLAAFQVYDLQPGPLLFSKAPELVWALIASLYIGNVMLLLLNLPLIRVWVKILEIPRPLLYAGILTFATLGVYSSANSLLDVLIMFAIGIVGFLIRRLDFPVGPIVLGVILGPLIETQFRRAMSIAQGDLSIFVTRPLSAAILAFAVGALVLPYLPRIVARLRGRRAPAGRLVFGDSED
jgi:putative tricarboxylic transport membrane protein